MMHQGLRDDIRCELDERGFAVMDRLIAQEDLAALAESFRLHEEHAVPMSAEILFTHTARPAERDREGPRGMRRLMNQWLNPYRRAPPLSTRAVAAAIRPVVEALLDEPSVLFQDVLMDKNGSHQPFPWHQDFPFWPVDAPIGLVIWAPLDPLDELSGGLCLAERSHRSGVGPAVDLHTGAAQQGSPGTVLDVTKYEVIRPRIAPGDAILFHPLAWHASPPNHTGRRRRVWSSTWLGASVRWSHARAPAHPLCRILEDGARVSTLEGKPG